MSDFGQAIAEFETAYVDFLKVATNFPQALQNEAGVCGTWSAREILAQLAGWISEAKRRYPRYGRGTGDIQYNRDAFNAVSIRMRRDKTYTEILEEVHHLGLDLATMARELTEAQIEKDGRYAEWLINLSREAHEHRLQLEQFIEAKV